MNQPPEDIKRWTARRKAAAIMEIIKGKTTAAEIARSHDLIDLEHKFAARVSLIFSAPNYSLELRICQL